MILINVIIVPAIDLDGADHTAFTVYSDSSGTLRSSAGWTLRDALDFYAQDFGEQRDDIILARPFITQVRYLRKHGMRM